VDDALIVDQVRASEPAGEAETFVERSHDTR